MSYTKRYADDVVEAVLNVWERRESVRGFRITEQPKALRQFTARFEPLGRGNWGRSALCKSWFERVNGGRLVDGLLHGSG